MDEIKIFVYGDKQGLLPLREELARRMRRHGPLIIQSLLASGPSGNLTPEHLADWADRLSEIGPTAVQIYTLSRGYPDAGLVPGSREELSLALEATARRGLAAEVF